MSMSHFAKTPNIAVPRSRFKQPFNHATSFNHGDLIPIDCFEIIPGDTHALRLSSLIRMGTPIAPIMSNIDCYIHAFFIPWRLVWEHTEEFYGANKTSAGPNNNVYRIPHAKMSGAGLGSISAGCVSHYLGKPICNVAVEASCLKERAYWLTWSEWYRAEQLQNPVILTKSDIGDIGSLDGSTLTFNSVPAKVCKKFDYFTAATIAPQYGQGVTVPLGSFAPIVIKDEVGASLPKDTTFEVKNENAFSGVTGSVSPVYAAASLGARMGSFEADLSQATAATINSIRYAFQVQKYLERSNFGSRFFEVLAVHYGVTSPDARLQRPEYLGGTSFAININQVLSTAGYAAGTTTQVGETGAVSVTANKSSIFTKGFVEPGFVMVMASTKQDQIYSQGLMREDFLFDRFEHYSPEFANLGDQAILNKEIMVTGSGDDDVFGYQEHWAELRYRQNRVSGLLDPSATGALDYWTLANKFASRPSLSGTFIKESRDNLTRCLKAGATGPDYIADFYFDYTATRELPTYTIPGLVDHFGVM